MSRGDSFILGVAMTTVALTVLIGNRLAAWILLFVGIALMVWPYYLDWRYGVFRPNPWEIYKMGAQELKEMCHDPKFKRWVDRTYPKQNDKHKAKTATDEAKG